LNCFDNSNKSVVDILEFIIFNFDKKMHIF
jgi:hypothetical protein